MLSTAYLLATVFALNYFHSVQKITFKQIFLQMWFTKLTALLEYLKKFSAHEI